MSDIDEFADQSESEAAPIQPAQQIKLKPFYQLFTPKILALLLTIVVMVGVIALLFYQNNAQKSALIKNQLLPLTQQLKQLKGLQKADKLVNQLLIAANAQDYVQLHAELISTDRELLQLKNPAQLFQQWLNKHKSAEDIVSRIQDSHTRNQQLKQSSIIQLQLMLFSMTPIIDKKLARQKLLYQQLQADEAKQRVTFNQANAYVKSSQQLNNLQKLHSLLAEVLLSFEQLTMYTPLASFELLRLNVEQIFIQNKQLTVDDTIKGMVDVNQQIEAFEKIMLTEQRALAKWQGYIRLAQDYHAQLKAQQQQIRQLLFEPYQPNQANQLSVINTLLAKFDMQLSDQKISVILLVATALLLLYFGYLLWQLRAQIRCYAQQSVEIIHQTLQGHEGKVVPANCAETQEIIKQLQRIAQPKHNEQEFQALSEQYHSSQQCIEQKKHALARLEKCNEQQRLDFKAQITTHFDSELARYQYLETVALSLVQQQAIIFNSKALIDQDSVSLVTQLGSLYQRLVQFHLALTMRSDKSILNLNDINLRDEIHAILFNKQKEQQYYGNQLFVSYDEQVQTQVKIDARLFGQLINLFIDILLIETSLNDCHEGQLHLRVQLKDKSAGQQLVSFVAKVSKPSVDTLPPLITHLLESQTTAQVISPLINIFTLFFTKQHGENIVAQLVDDGYQVSFELPLAIAATTNNVDKVSVENASNQLLSFESFVANKGIESGLPLLLGVRSAQHTENSATASHDEAAFDFSQYLTHQGTAELALFMLDDYTQANHQQLDALIEAIKAKNIAEAQLAVAALTLNAKILSAPALQSLCSQWSKLLTGSEIPSSLKKINALLKETRLALTKIDAYAEAI